MNWLERPWLRIVRQASLRRAILSRASALAEACGNGHEDSEILSAGSALYRECLSVDEQARRRVRPTEELLEMLTQESTRTLGPRIRTYIPQLDRRFSGIATGEVLTVVARPQVGKSAFALKWALDCARAGEPVIFYSLEMPRQQCFSRLIQQALLLTDEGVSAHARVGWKELKEKQRSALKPILQNIVIIDRGRTGIEQLDAGVHEAQVHLGSTPRAAIIDYLGLLSTGSRNLPLYQRISEAALDVKSFAKRNDLAVMLLCQSGRDVDPAKTEGAARLGIDAARDSGQVEEAADFLLTLWRPELRSTLAEEERRSLAGKLEAALVKNRRGPLGEVHLWLDPATTLVEEREDG